MIRFSPSRHRVLVPLIALTAILAGAASPQGGTTPARGAQPPPSAVAACEGWAQVNEAAFGLPSSFDENGNPIDPPPEFPYQSEEGFEVLVFRGQLYLGMEADNTLGARLWRTRQGVLLPLGQRDWEEVIADENGHPFGVSDLAQVDHIDSLAAFRGYIYASTANRGPAGGTRLFRSPTGDPASWEDALTTIGPGFGDPANENFKDMQVFDGWLCGGTWNNQTGAQVWCSQNGTDWVQANRSGFGDPASRVIWSGYVFDGALYFGVQNVGPDPQSRADDRGLLFRTRSLQGDPAWEEVFRGPTPSARVDLLGELNGFLYIGVPTRAGLVVYRSPDGGPGSWAQVSLPGLDGSARNAATVVDGAAVYNGALYLALANSETGVQFWRTTGVPQGESPLLAWERLPGPGGAAPASLFAELIPFNGQLYAWTSNYALGQQVWATRCPLCQRTALAGPGRYVFEGVGVAFELRSGSLERLQVCVYPELPPVEGVMGVPVKRTYHLSAQPASAVFSAALTFTYTPEELAASSISDAGSLYLARREGDGWQPCPPALRRWDPQNRTLTCTRVTQLGTWGIFGGGALPLQAQPSAFRAQSPLIGLLGLAVLLLMAVVSRLASVRDVSEKRGQGPA